MRTMILALVFLVSSVGVAQSFDGLPTLPTGGSGFTGSVGAGFTDFRTLAPDADFTLNRGVFVSGQLERGFQFLHLYLTLGLNYMDTNGTANYYYKNLSSTTTYTLNDVAFSAKIYEGSLGLKFKLIENYWFRPYVEGGGMASYNQISYGSNLSSLNSTGTGYRTNDSMMGSGYYGEAGVEIDFTEKYGLKLAARESIMQTKKMETLDDHTVRMDDQTFYLSLLFGL